MFKDYVCFRVGGVRVFVVRFFFWGGGRGLLASKKTCRG